MKVFEVENKKCVLKKEVNIPICLDNEILIKIHFTGVNRLDLIQKEKGILLSSKVIGVECSGIVVNMGRNVKGFDINDRVTALCTNGAYAEFVVVNYKHCIKVPNDLSLKKAAAIMEVYLTSYQCLSMMDNNGKSIMIHAGASNIGQSCIQIAKLMNIKHIITTSSTSKCNICKSLGASIAIDRMNKGWENNIKKYLDDNNLKGVDFILDCVGKDYWGKNMKLINIDGIIVYIAFLSGANVNVNLYELLIKRVIIKFTTLTSRSNEYKNKLVHNFKDFSNDLNYFLDDKKLKVQIDKVFPFEDVEECHEYMKSNKSSGKILLKVI